MYRCKWLNSACYLPFASNPMQLLSLMVRVAAIKSQMALRVKRFT
jgi:hypothetical protein